MAVPASTEDAVALVRRLMLCANGPDLGPMTWILVLSTGMVLLLVSVRHVLKTAKPARREALHGAAIVFSTMFLIAMAVLYHCFDTGKISMRRGVLVACNEPASYWCCMAVGAAISTMMLAVAVSCVVRLRRPYRRYTDLVA